MLFRRKNILFWVAIFFACIVSSASEVPKDSTDPKPAAKVEEPNVLEILSNTANDITTTLTKSKAPLKDLQTKYSGSLGKFFGGSFMGYVVAYLIKAFTLSIAKVFSVGVAVVTFAALMGWVGKPTGMAGFVLSSVADQAMRTEEMMENRLDMNGDGNVGLDDIIALALRVERAVLRQNLPFTLGSVLGASLGIYF